MRVMIGLGAVATGMLVAAALALSDNVVQLPTTVPTTATPVLAGNVPAAGTVRSVLLPTASSAEQHAASQMRLYLTAFQNQNVSVIDPLSGHVLHEIPVDGDQAGMAIAPDGARLYVVDGQANDSQLRVFDTRTWQMIHQEPVAERLLLLGGNPISLSGDGRWLVVSHYSYTRSKFWNTVFDTQKMEFLPVDPLQQVGCSAEAPLRLVGRPGHPRLYTLCAGNMIALDAETFAMLWQMPAPSTHPPDLALSPDGMRLYGVYPQGGAGCFSRNATDLGLYGWEATTGRMVEQVQLSDQVPVPMGTCGRGGGVYLTISPDGMELYLAWEDRLWKIAAGSFRVTSELRLPSAVDGMALSTDGRELYLLPATMGDLTVRERGMWVVDTIALNIVRHASDWPQLIEPFMFGVPAGAG